jgi:CrcB protein
VNGVADVLVVAAGSAVGGMARYALVVVIEARRSDTGWPLGTLVVNLLGCFLMGGVTSSSLPAGMAALGLLAALGSFTTVSAFVLESWQRRVHPATWIGYGVVTVLGCLLMFRVGSGLA